MLVALFATMTKQQCKTPSAGRRVTVAKDPLTDSLAEDLPPYEPQRIIDASFPERIRLACTTWADSSPNRPSVMALYWGKYFIGLIGIWAFWCSFNVGYPGFLQFREWAFTAEAAALFNFCGWFMCDNICIVCSCAMLCYAMLCYTILYYTVL